MAPQFGDSEDNVSDCSNTESSKYGTDDTKSGSKELQTKMNKV